MGLGDGHDLGSTRFKGDLVLEHCYDGEYLLKRGDEGPSVQRVQQALIDLDLLPLQPGADGIFGDQTGVAIKKFQTARGLIGDSILGPNTMAALDVAFSDESPDVQTVPETIIQGVPGMCPSTDQLQPWAELISFRPPTIVQTQYTARFPQIMSHKIEEANGPISLDFYPVVVRILPALSGTPVSAAELLSHVRLNLNSFLDTRYGEIRPYDPEDELTWASPMPISTVIHWDMNGWLNLDDGAVVVSDYAEDHWIFSTIFTLGDGEHPVSGNRQFGFSQNADGSYIFYTRGADRPNGLIDNLISDTVFAGAHALWTSFQIKLALFIGGQGGSATLLTPTRCRYEWEAVQATYHHPGTPWL